MHIIFFEVFLFVQGTTRTHFLIYKFKVWEKREVETAENKMIPLENHCLWNGKRKSQFRIYTTLCFACFRFRVTNIFFLFDHVLSAAATVLYHMHSVARSSFTWYVNLCFNYVNLCFNYVNYVFFDFYKK